MMSLKITVDDQLSRELAQFGSDMPKLLDSVLRQTANAFKQFIVRSYLSGQMLRRRTGKLQKTIRVARSKKYPHSFWIFPAPSGGLANIYEQPGGVIIRPKVVTAGAALASGKRKRAYRGKSNAKVLHWVQDGKDRYARQVYLAPRPFMSRASAAFGFEGRLSSTAEKVMESELRKRFG